MTIRLRHGAGRAAPIGVAVLAFGVSFGWLARTAGMGRVVPIVMSATTFAGSAQFAVASILHGGGTVAAAVLAAVLLNVRYAPISISVADLFSGSATRRLVQSQLIVDESWAIAARGGGRFERGVLLGAGLLLYPCWVGGTALGGLGGGLPGDPQRLGRRAALPAVVVTQTVASGGHVVVDARVAGVAAAAVALRLRAPILVAVVLAAGLTAGLRAL